MEVYFDNAATTRAYDSVCHVMTEAMQVNYGNPSSLHMKGVDAERYIRSARETIARVMKIDEKEIIFTSGGTESNNMALIGGALANQRAGKHIITTRIEHASVYNPLFELENKGFEVTYLPVDAMGTVDLERLRAAIRPDTIIVSVMCVNNEIGTIEPLDEIGKIVKEKNPGTLYHVDAIQGFGKMRIYPKRLGIDMLSVSGHKLHGPKGCGFLYVRDKVKVRPLILGGGQQKDMRSGTENVPGIAGLCEAVRCTYDGLEEKLDRLYGLRAYFIQQVGKLERTRINGFLQREEGFFGPAPHIVSVSFEDVRAEVLLHALEERGIYVSSGSACSSNHPAISGTLKAIGVEKKYLDATIRFSFSYDTTKEEIDYCIEALNIIVPMLRRFTPGGRK